MRAFFLLLRVQLRGLVNSLAPYGPGTSAAKRTRRLGWIAVGATLLAALDVLYMVLLALGLYSIGLAELIPAVAVLLGSLLGVAFTFMKARGTLFGFRDYDLVMSLPVSRRVVVASRAAALFGAAIGLAAITMVPLYAVLFILCGTTPLGVIYAALSIVLAPLAPTALATFASYAVTALAARFRHANLAYVVLGMLAMVAVVFGIYAVSFTVQTDTDAAALAAQDLARVLGDVLAAAYPPAAWASEAIINDSFAAFAAFAAISLGVAALCLEIMQRYYLQLNGALMGRRRNRRGSSETVQAGTHTRSPFFAITLKELRGLIGIPSYAFNCLFGYVLIIAIAVALAVMGLRELVTTAIDPEEFGLTPDALNAMGAQLALLVPWVFAFCTVCCDSSVISISLEGRASWIMATAPVPVRTILAAKLAASAIPTAASLVASIVILGIAGETDILGALEIAVLGFGMYHLWINIGLAADVRNPNYQWSSPHEVVKRGAPVMITVFGGMISVFALGALTVAVTPGALGITATHGIILGIGAVALIGGQLIFTRTARHATLFIA